MESSSKGEETRKRTYLKKELNLSDLRSQSGKPGSSESKEEVEDLELDEDPQLLREALELAPEKIRDIVQKLRDPKANKSFYRYFMLTGPSGTGKSILAKAIAHELGKKYLFVEAPSLQGHFLNETTENVYKLFKQVNQHPEHPVLILDEFNALTDTYNQENRDTADTAKGLWTLLDKQKKNDNFLMIATTNETKKMPHQLQTRFFNKIIEVEKPDIVARKRMLQFCLREHTDITIADECNDAYFNELAQRLNDCCRRTIDALINDAVLRAEKEPNKKLTRQHLNAAYDYTLRHKEKFCDPNEHLTIDERTLRQNKEQFEANQQLQMKTAIFSSTINHFSINDQSKIIKTYFPNVKFDK
jgi:SpoVK/Ycf46/Vps4 family AAA+-type ATPase